MADLERIIEEHEIVGIRRAWGYCRDLGDWDSMRLLFHHDATIAISWYEGGIDGFIAGSREVFAKRKPEPDEYDGIMYS